MENGQNGGGYPCRFCGTVNSESLYPTRDIWGDDYEIRRCFSCHCYFLSPPPTPEQLSRAYDDTYYGESEEKFSFPLLEKALDWFRKGRARQLAGIIRDGSCILDVGCGNGRFLQYMSTLGDFRLYGTELEGNSAKRAQRVPGMNLTIGALKKEDFPDSFFDAVTLFHVFEHLENPQETLRILSSLIKPGGILMISFPNIGSTQARFFKGKWLHLDPPRHLLFFEPDDFSRLLKSYGFQPLKIRYRSAEQNPFGMAQSLLNLVLRKREVLFERLKGNRGYAPEYGPFHILAQKLFFILSFPLFMLCDVLAGYMRKGATVGFIFRKGN